jgi:hypothetical protein
VRCSLAWASLSTIWLLLPAVVVFVVGDLLQVMPHDFWWHVRTGQIILASHAVPVIDSFTFTRSGFPWTNEAWLMQVILYLLYAAGGLPLVIFAVALTVAGGYALIEAAAYAACRGRGDDGGGGRERDELGRPARSGVVSLLRRARVAAAAT